MGDQFGSGSVTAKVATGIQSVFVSYTRKDQARVTTLLGGLRRLGYEVWFDQELSGGQEWWETILGQIRGCHAVLLAVSPAGLESDACRAEIGYARQVGKAVLPVMVEPVLPALLPRDLAQLHLVDYTGRNQNEAFELLAALKTLPLPGPVPDPLPAAPLLPLSYVHRLGEKVAKPALDQDEQYAVVGGLREALQDPELRDAAIDLLRRFNRRKDLYRGPAKEVDDMVAALQPPPPPGPPSSPLPLHPILPKDDAVAIPPPPPPPPPDKKGRSPVWTFVIGVAVVIFLGLLIQAIFNSQPPAG